VLTKNPQLASGSSVIDLEENEIFGDVLADINGRSN
jgi:hypothetical protein